ncbi:hypothetical protein [Fervidibacter sacchari]
MGKRLGSPRSLPSHNSRKPNDFGAQQNFVINHWLKPMAWLVLKTLVDKLMRRSDGTEKPTFERRR